MQKPTYLILFPGAWGNANAELIRWWFNAVISCVVAKFGHNVVILPMVYGHDRKDTSLDDYANDALAILRGVDIPNNARVIAVSYSMGGQVMRLVAAKWSGRFTDQIIIASGGRRGMRFFGLCRGVWAVLKAFTTGLVVTGWVKLTTVEEIHRLFFNKELMSPAVRVLCEDILENTHAESRWACLRLGVPFVRRRMPALKGTVHVIVPWNDVMFGDELDGRGVCGERWRTIAINGGHGAILHHGAMEEAFRQVIWSE